MRLRHIGDVVHEAFHTRSSVFAVELDEYQLEVGLDVVDACPTVRKTALLVLNLMSRNLMLNLRDFYVFVRTTGCCFWPPFCLKVAIRVNYRYCCMPQTFELAMS